MRTNYLAGYLWCENIGWVRLGAATSPPGGATQWANTSQSNYGVNNDGNGNLSGYAWSENAGWINFSATGATGANAAKINTTTRQFSGYAWSENAGWIKLSGTAQDLTSYYVQTTWPPTVNSWTYTHSTKALVLNFNESMVDTQTTPASFTIATSYAGANAFSLSGGTVSGGTATTLTITITDTDRDIISKWDGDGIASHGTPGGIYLSWSAAASQDQYTNNLPARASANGLQCATWQEDAVAPTITSTTYNASNKRVTFVFSQPININTFTAANLANLSIQDGTTTVTLSGATIISTSDGATMVAKLTAAEDAALYAIRNNTLRVVVAANCGIKDLAANELAQNTYASSAYSVTYQADTTAPVVASTTYNQASRKLTIIFDEYIDVSTFTQANLGNLSIQDGTTTVNLTSATIITTQNSTIMEATLTVAEDNALYAIKDNTLRLVVGASCGIKDLAANELAQNTYATAYPVTYTTATATPITGILKDSKSALIIANATIKLYDSAGNLRAETTSDTSGNFSFNVNIPSGDYTLNITKLPLFKNKEQAITITAGTAENTGDVLIDPFGIVYDAVTGEAIAGATVTLYTGSGNIYTGSPQPNPQSSRADGGYNFDVAPGTYYIGAVKDGYRNYTGANFTVVADIVEWNIPMVPNNQAASTYLSIIKQANKKTAAAGDIITYTINIKNLSSTLIASSVTVTDNLPHGFKYIPGSTVIDGAKAVDPTGTRSLSWPLGNLATQATKKITYRVRVGVDAKIGKNENSARVSAIVGGNATSAGPSIAGVEIRDSFFSDSGMLIGKVFEDKNGNGIQDKDEPGIPNVSLILEDGKVIVTDEFGRYSVPNIEKGQHVIRLDQRVSPGGPFSKIKPEGHKQPVPEKTKVASIEEEPLVTQKDDISQPAVAQDVVEREAIIDRRQLDTWRKEALGQEQTQIKKQGQAQDKEGAKPEEKPKDIIKRTPRTELLNKYGDPQSKQDKPRSLYRSDIPKESKFFKIFGSETAKVNFPVKLLSEEEAKKEAEIDKKPNQFMLVGLADGTIGYLNAKGNISNLESSVNAPYEESFYKDGSIKLYLKGLVKGEYLLTAALDTDKKNDRRHLFEYVNPEKYYPIYGDSSSYFQETDTRGKFYARIDKGDSYGLWGNYNTQEFTKPEFTRYNRTLAGSKAHIEIKDWVKEKDKMPVKPAIDFFYSSSTQEQVSETFAAKGISGPFWLGKTPLLEYAESIRIETRDKGRSDVVLHTKTLSRDLDYEIDYDSGRIFFKEPISTSDENDDPNFIVVDYEFVPSSGENKYYLTGSRLQAKMFGDKIALGGQFIAENHISSSPRLFGTDIVFQPDSTTRLAAEWGYSKNYLDSNDALIKEDNAWKVEGLKTLGKLKIQGYYSDVGNRFRNPVNVAEKGMEKYGATADYRLTDATSLVLDHWRNLSTISKTFDRSTSLDLYHKKENYFLGAGYAFKEYEDEQNLTPNKDTWAASLKGGLKLTQNFIASLEQEFKNEQQSKTAAPIDNKISATTGRLDYKLSEDTAVYIKNRFVKELHKKYQNIQSIGFSRRTADGDAYVEYGFGGGTVETTFGLKREQNLSERLTLSSYMNNRISADKNEENIGFGTRYEVMEGLFTSFNFENTRAKNSDASYYKQNSQSVAFDYLPFDTENSYGIKFERRKAQSTREINFFGYVKHYLNQEFSLLFNSEYLTEHSGEDTLRINRKAVTGLAYRPIYNDNLNFLGKYEYKDELNHTTSSSSTDYATHITSLEAGYELNPKVDLFGKYALKFQNEKDNDLNTHTLIDMVIAKLTYKFTSIFDLTSYYRIINDRGSRVVKQAPALEAGVLFFKQFRLGLGYNFLDYQDKDAGDEGYSGVGPYCNLSAKF